MAGYDGVRDAVESIALLLRGHITASGEAGLSGTPVRTDSPRELELLNIASAVSVWLYRIEVDKDLANRPASRPSPTLLSHRPLPLRLWLAVVPMNTDTPTRLLLLGRAAQVLDEHRQLRGASLAGNLAGDGTTLLLTADSPSSYDLAQLWAGQQTYARPAFCLTMSGLTLDPHHQPVAVPVVLDAAADLFEIVGSSS